MENKEEIIKRKIIAVMDMPGGVTKLSVYFVKRIATAFAAGFTFAWLLVALLFLFWENDNQ